MLLNIWTGICEYEYEYSPHTVVGGESPYVVGGGQDCPSVKEDLYYLVEQEMLRMRKRMREDEHEILVENEHKQDHDITMGTMSMTL